MRAHFSVLWDKRRYISCHIVWKKMGEKHFSDVEKVVAHSKQLAELAPLKCWRLFPSRPSWQITVKSL